ncbi:MAG TPA: NAD(P)-binding domain-containing protein, partial [Rhizomicrobium sp.]|nr:NAD(P)-binding domain-containing protein [Rhizomicrobium sp.]
MAEGFQIAIIGSGPAGMSAATRAAARGIAHVLLEKTDHLSDTIYRYQKGKHVMATPVSLTLRSDCSFDAGKREAILQNWNEQTGKAKANVRYKAEVKSVTGAKGDFTITLTSGDTIKTETVIMAIGTQGNPNLVRCDGAKLPHVQYQLDDPREYFDEHIVVIGGGDAGIENARGLAEDQAQGNIVTMVNRSKDFSKAKAANVEMLMEAQKAGRISILSEASPSKIEEGWITIETPEGESRLPCNRVIARMGSAAPRGFVESVGATPDPADLDEKGRPKLKGGIQFSSAARDAFPKLTPQFETTVPGVYAIGALAGYPLIKHCMNQGYDVVEFIAGNTELKPADEPLLEARLKDLPIKKSVADWITFLGENVEILKGLSPLQMREFLLDCTVKMFKENDVIFERNAIGSSLFGIAGGSVKVEINPQDPSIVIPIGQGSIFGEVGLISGRRRGATIRAGKDCIVVEIPRTATLKLMGSNEEAKKTVNRITTERHLLQIFGSGLQTSDIAEILKSAKVEEIRPGQTVIKEGQDAGEEFLARQPRARIDREPAKGESQEAFAARVAGEKTAEAEKLAALGPEAEALREGGIYDIFIVRSGSMTVEKALGGKQVFLSYIPAGSYFGEMALVDRGRRTATVRATVRSQVVRLDGKLFRELLDKKPTLKKKLQDDMKVRQEINNFIEQKKKKFGGVVDMYSEVAEFLVKQGIGEATDALLIDETLCIGCDNCERACADSHDGLSRLNREAGKTYAHLHVPTSCRHCEQPQCMTDCPPNAIRRGPDGEVFISDACIGCGNCQRNCPYGVIRMDSVPPKKPGLLQWMLFGMGPGPGEPDKDWLKK